MAAVLSLDAHRARTSQAATVARLERTWRAAEDVTDRLREQLDQAEGVARDALAAYRSALSGAVAPASEPRTFATILADLREEEGA